MVATTSTVGNDEPSKPEEKTEVVEKRVRSTVIRRRRRAVKPVEEGPAQKAAEAPAKAAVPTVGTAAVVEAPQPAEPAQPKQPAVEVPAAPKAAQPDAAPLPGTVAKPEPKKAPRRRRTKAEWEMEDIKRAGGLRAYAEETVVGEEPAPTAEPAAPINPATVEIAAPKPTPAPTSMHRARTTREFRPTGMRRKRSLRRETKQTAITQIKESKRVVRIKEQITVGELSQAMGVKANDLMRQLMQLGTMATINQPIDVETATLIAQEYGYQVESMAVNEDELLAGQAEPKKAAETATGKSEGELRLPVVAVMGHVDHGKTSILDAVRKTNIADGEAGGITQHIGASEVKTPKGTITFLDTPGHEAFTALRARGAQVTDLAVIVVAADDGVMPQTKEAIDHAKAAGVPIIVAVNKIDKADADADRVKRELTEYGIVPEEWGGDTICVPVSAKSGEGIDQLLEMILLQAEVLELRADPKLPASGTVIEARLDRGRGPVATVLVQSGTLKQGAPLVCGTSYGRVRALINPLGKTVKSIGPGYAAEILGLGSVPTAGDAMVEATDEKAAKTVAEDRARKQRETQLAGRARVSLEEFQQQLAAGESKVLHVIVKADVQGSAEAVVDALNRLATEKVKVKVIHSGVGGVTESDVLLAVASEAIIIGFNVAPESKARRVAEAEKVEIKRYSIIYELIDDVKKAMAGLLEPTRTEKVLGRAEVREVFKVSKVGTVAGCSISEGKITRSCKARLLRDSVPIFEGDIDSLKRFKEDVREVQEGYECGIALEGFQDIKPGDIIEGYIIEETAATL